MPKLPLLVGSGYSFSVLENEVVRLSAENVRTPDFLSWDTLIDKSYSGIMSAVGSTVLKEILGPNAWERGVAEDLKTIIAKLDQILDEIRMLRDFIRDNERENWRDVLHAALTTRIENLTNYMQAVRESGTLEDAGTDGEFFKINTNDLSNALGQIVNYRSQTTGEPLGIPLYAAVQAGICMLIVAYRVCGNSTSTIRLTLEKYHSVFQEWKKIIEAKAQPIRTALTAEGVALNSWPKEGAIVVTGPGGYSFASQLTRDRGVFSIKIDGGMDRPFTGWDAMPILDLFSVDDPKWVNQATMAPAYPWQYFPPPFTLEWKLEVGKRDGAFLGDQGTAHTKAHAMCKYLNERRSNLLANLESLERLEALARSMQLACDRIHTLPLKE